MEEIEIKISVCLDYFMLILEELVYIVLSHIPYKILIKFGPIPTQMDVTAEILYP